MRFSRKRGRPKQHKPAIDQGTKELQQHRQANATLEPLHYCLKRQLISEEQCQAGAWFAWLHSVQYGVIRPRSVQWGESSNGNVRTELWREYRKNELDQAVILLKNAQAQALIYRLCIYHESPTWLRLHISEARRVPDYQRTVDGLDQLLKLQHRIGAKKLVSH